MLCKSKAVGKCITIKWGAFISYSWLNNKKTKIITAQGYVYAPNFEKSKYIRELEAIIVSGIK